MATTCDMASVVGDRIRRARKAMKIKQDALAAEVGYSSRAAIAQIENGLTLPSVDKALAIARTLNVRIGWLLGDEEEMEVEQRQVPEWIKEKISSTRERLITTLTHELDDLLLHG